MGKLSLRDSRCGQGLCKVDRGFAASWNGGDGGEAEPIPGGQ